MSRRRLLVVDDEEGVRRSLTGVLEDEGFEVRGVASAEEALATLKAELPAAVLLDVWLPGRDGIEILPELRRLAPSAPVIMMSGHGTIETAVRATRLGAFDFIEKPVSLDKLLVTVRNAIRQARLLETKQILSRQLAGDEELIGDCEPMRHLRDQVMRAAPSTARVLITGENGTGKELVARMVHRHSPRRDEAFIEVNCAAIPEDLIESELFGHVRGSFTGATDNRRGKFELADEGTLLLDEVGDMSLRVQAKVLRALQEQVFEPVGGAARVQVDVRVVAATNKNLEQEIAGGRFREDLYFRLNVLPLHVPPLRERGGDIRLLAEHFAALFAAGHGRPPLRYSAGALAALEAWRWPGNVRELRNLVERLVILSDGDEVGVEDLPAALGGDADRRLAELPENATLRDARDDFERRYILKILRDSDGNVARAAESLGVERSSLYRKLRQYGVRDAE